MRLRAHALGVHLGLILLGGCSSDPGGAPTHPGVDTICRKVVCPDTIPKTSCGMPVCPADTVHPDTSRPVIVHPDTSKGHCTVWFCPDSLPKPPCAKPACRDSLPQGTDTAVVRRRAEALIDSGLQRALDFAGGGPSLERSFQWVPAGSDSSGYAWSLQRLGLYRRVFVSATARSANGSLTRTASALVGQSMNLDDYPVFGLTNHSGNMVLALNAEVSGPVYLYSGSVRKATDNAVRYTGRTASVGLWESGAPIREELPFRFPWARAWDSAAALELERMASEAPLRDDAWSGSQVLTGEVLLTAGIREHQRIYVLGTLTLGRGVDLRDCMVLASEVRIESDARIEGGVVFSAGKMSIAGAPRLKGQFLARDTLTVSIQSVLEDYPAFYAEGRYEEYLHIGGINVMQAQGEGIFLTDSRTDPIADINPSMRFGSATDLRGFASSDAYMDPRGRFRGCMLGDNLRFTLGGTIWLGHLGYGDYGFAPIGLTLPFPAMATSASVRPPLLFMRQDWAP
ncbi:MAG: hypothetical protein ABI036_08655 [Fibrobacteria bacterium]